MALLTGCFWTFQYVFLIFFDILDCMSLTAITDIIMINILHPSKIPDNLYRLLLTKLLGHLRL